MGIKKKRFLSTQLSITKFEQNCSTEKITDLVSALLSRKERLNFLFHDRYQKIYFGLLFLFTKNGC